MSCPTSAKRSTVDRRATAVATHEQAMSTVDPVATAEQQRRWRAKKAAEEGREPGKVGRPVEKPCGTTAAYKRHQRRDEPIDDACRDAWAEYQRELYQRRKARKG